MLLCDGPASNHQRKEGVFHQSWRIAFPKGLWQTMCLAVCWSLGFRMLMLVVLWSNLCLWNGAPEAAGHILSKMRTTTQYGNGLAKVIFFFSAHLEHVFALPANWRWLNSGRWWKGTRIRWLFLGVNTLGKPVPYFKIRKSHLHPVHPPW